MKEGDIIGVFKYAKVVNVEGPERVVLKDVEKGNEYVMQGAKLISEVFNATTALEHKKVTRTEMEKLLVEAGHQPVSVSFKKAGGDDREMVGVRIGDGNFGRSLFKEFGGDSVKQVDHRTLYKLVMDGVEYTLK
jgi:hypothetical protein